VIRVGDIVRDSTCNRTDLPVSSHRKYRVLSIDGGIAACEPIGAKYGPVYFSVQVLVVEVS
jgi:hypothetical protein